MSEIRVRNTGTIKLFESDNTSHVTIASPASLSANRTITIPDADVTLGAGTTINNNADNRVITGSGTANTLEGEANLIYNGTILGVGASADLGQGIHIKASDSSATVNANEADNLVIEKNSDSGMSILSATNGTGNIYFGDSGDNNIGRIQYSHGSNLMYFTTNASEAMRIHSNQVISATAGIALGVGNANTASNVLDDYEEGEFANALDINGTTQTAYSSGRSHLKYVKIGSLVHCVGLIDTDGQTLGTTGQIFVRLPFTTASSGSNSFAGSRITTWFNVGGDTFTGYYYLNENDTKLETEYLNTASTYLKDGGPASVGSTSNRVFMFLNITYQTDA